MLIQQQIDAAHRAGEEEGKKKAEEAAKKAEKKQKCLQDNLEVLGLCRNDAEAERNQRLDACYVIDDVDAAGICFFDTSTHSDLRVKGCKEDKAVDDQWCESNY